MYIQVFESTRENQTVHVRTYECIQAHAQNMGYKGGGKYILLYNLALQNGRCWRRMILKIRIMTQSDVERDLSPRGKEINMYA